MAKNSAVNLDITNNADGFDISGGTTKRKITVTGGDMTFTGSGARTYTLPAGDVTLASTSQLHTQHTDTGTTGTTFAIDSDNSGPILKNASGVLEVRNSGDSDYADLKCENLTVTGTTTTVNSETVTIDDNIIVLNNNEAGVPSANAGIEVERGSSTNSTIIWDEAADKWKAGVVGSEIELVDLSSSQSLSNKTIGVSQLSGQVALANGGTAANLSDPGADRVMFWDESANAVTWLTMGTNLSISDTTLNASGGSGFTWNEVTGTTQAAAVNNGYLANNGSLVTITLPDTAALGSVVRVSGVGAGGWKIAQNASEIIHFGNTDTTTGTGGYLQSTHVRDSIELVCCVANTEWNVLSSQGNITVA